jgi:hypothetical protein
MGKFVRIDTEYGLIISSDLQCIILWRRLAWTDCIFGSINQSINQPLLEQRPNRFRQIKQDAVPAIRCAVVAFFAARRGQTSIPIRHHIIFHFCFLHRMTMGQLRALLLWPIGTMIAIHVSRTEAFGYHNTRIFTPAPIPTCYGSRTSRRRSAAVFTVTSPRHRRTNQQQEIDTPIAIAAVMAQQSTLIDVDPQEEEEEVDFLTTMQTKQLRKEVEKRRAWKILNTISFENYPVEDNQSYNVDLIHDLVRALAADGLVELRGISKNSRRHVYAIAEEIAADADELRCTFLLTVKGHAAVYFSPTATAVPSLRTTRKENQWTKREKAARDNRGQIIIDSEEETDD